MAVSQFGNVPREVMNYHLIIVSKVGFYDLWISGAIEMELLTNPYFYKIGNVITSFARHIFSENRLCQQLQIVHPFQRER